MRDLLDKIRDKSYSVYQQRYEGFVLTDEEKEEIYQFAMDKEELYNTAVRKPGNEGTSKYSYFTQIVRGKIAQHLHKLIKLREKIIEGELSGIDEDLDKDEFLKEIKNKRNE
jgi:hypothetical protein